MLLLIEGFPRGLRVDFGALEAFMKTRSPGLYPWESTRSESDVPHFISGIENGVTTGGEIRAEIYNTDPRSSDYAGVNTVPRPSHADYAAVMKYGEGVDLRGGGHFSGRLTCLLCAAGGLFLQLLGKKNIAVAVHLYSVGNIRDIPFDEAFTDAAAGIPENSPFPVIDKAAGEKMKELIIKTGREGDSVGGIIECAVTGLPAGLGEHMFAGAEGRIALAVFSVPAVKGVEFGSGFYGASLKGSENNDPFYFDGGRVRTKTNNCGGILGGMTDGMPLVFRAAVKPTPSIAKTQDSVDLKQKKNVRLSIAGRHDPCVAPRAAAAIKAVTAAAIYDMLADGDSK